MLDSIFIHLDELEIDLDGLKCAMATAGLKGTGIPTIAAAKSSTTNSIWVPTVVSRCAIIELIRICAKINVFSPAPPSSSLTGVVQLFR